MSYATHYKPFTTQTLSVSGTSAAVTNGFSDGINVVRLVSTTNCHVVFGLSPTATTSSMYIPAGVPEYFSVAQGMKVAAIQNSSSGTLYVTEMTQ